MAVTTGAKMSHVNLMTDTVIANLPEVGLRSVLRSMLATDPSVTSLFEDRARSFLTSSSVLNGPGRDLAVSQRTGRAMIGCGLCFESIRLYTDLVKTASVWSSDAQRHLGLETISALDGDIIQACTATQKVILSRPAGQALQSSEMDLLKGLLDALAGIKTKLESDGQANPCERSLAALRDMLASKDKTSEEIQSTSFTLRPIADTVETFRIGDKTLPRLFSGLWQLSSPSWGYASAHAIRQQLEDYANRGFVAYDMADHYGDAEVVFGEFRAACSEPAMIFGATKYCVFARTTVTREAVQDNVRERCRRMASDHVDLLQFHWQFYDDPQYIPALRYLAEDPKVHLLGLCNFDAQRMREICDAGIKVHTNQVQFSLIDSRPMFGMGAACMEYNVKLLTYGTLCGGFLAEKWLDRAEPNLFDDGITPSQRKYYEMILNWGSWTLLQALLRVLKTIAVKHGVSISNVATRWILDFPYVGAVIVGTRMGVSGHAEENLASYGWRLDDDDQASIEEVLDRSNRSRLVDLLGDCGGEYR